jgi:hypothetical protein
MFATTSGATPSTSPRGSRRGVSPIAVLASVATVKGPGSDYSFNGPHKIDNKEGRVLEAFFVSHQP